MCTFLLDLDASYFLYCSLFPFLSHKPLLGLRPAKPICKIFYSCSFLLLGRLVGDQAFGSHGLGFEYPRVRRLTWILPTRAKKAPTKARRPSLGSHSLWSEYQRVRSVIYNAANWVCGRRVGGDRYFGALATCCKNKCCNKNGNKYFK
jgi:hypothetical protein